MTHVAIWCILIYRNTLSLLKLPSCRFFPSCSEYATIALKRHGFFRGAWLAAMRLCRCHPFAMGGFDPVR